jgi:hypothetical protein
MMKMIVEKKSFTMDQEVWLLAAPQVMNNSDKNTDFRHRESNMEGGNSY